MPDKEVVLVCVSVCICVNLHCVCVMFVTASVRVNGCEYFKMVVDGGGFRISCGWPLGRGISSSDIPK